MKKVIIGAISLFLLIATAQAASAISVDVTYTADNIVQAWFQNGGAPVAQTLGSNAADWTQSDTATLTLSPGQDYQLIWLTENSDTNPSLRNNPGGFLGQIGPSESLLFDSLPGSLLSSVSWEVYFDASQDPYNFDVSGVDFDTFGWEAATAYGANDNTSTIWYQNSGSVDGIAGSAQWIWDDKNFNDPGAPWYDESVFVKVEFSTVPEPTTMLLFGTGLFGLAAFGRKKFMKRGQCCKLQVVSCRQEQTPKR